MEKQNITLSLPKDLLRKAKAAAAARDTSLSDFLRRTLESQVTQENRYKAAERRQLMLLKRGFDLGTNGQWAFSREDLHERR